jgi:hypothetical protein
METSGINVNSALTASNNHKIEFCYYRWNITRSWIIRYRGLSQLSNGFLPDDGVAENCNTGQIAATKEN